MHYNNRQGRRGDTLYKNPANPLISDIWPLKTSKRPIVWETLKNQKSIFIFWVPEIFENLAIFTQTIGTLVLEYPYLSKNEKKRRKLKDFYFSWFQLNKYCISREQLEYLYTNC